MKFLKTYKDLMESISISFTDKSKQKWKQWANPNSGVYWRMLANKYPKILGNYLGWISPTVAKHMGFPAGTAFFIFENARFKVSDWEKHRQTRGKFARTASGKIKKDKEGEPIERPDMGTGRITGWDWNTNITGENRPLKRSEITTKGSLDPDTDYDDWNTTNSVPKNISSIKHLIPLMKASTKQKGDKKKDKNFDAEELAKKIKKEQGKERSEDVDEAKERRNTIGVYAWAELEDRVPEKTEKEFLASLKQDPKKAAGVIEFLATDEALNDAFPGLSKQDIQIALKLPVKYTRPKPGRSGPRTGGGKNAVIKSILNKHYNFDDLEKAAAKAKAEGQPSSFIAKLLDHDGPLYKERPATNAGDIRNIFPVLKRTKKTKEIEPEEETQD